MDVTRHNFPEAIVKFEDDVCNADFIAFDLELSGLDRAHFCKPFPTDDQYIRYQKLKFSVESFYLFQVGICCFERNPENHDEFIARPYNFWVFPNDGVLRCEAICLKFLSTHKFDFSKCFTDGISYVNAKTEPAIVEDFFQAAEQERLAPVEKLETTPEDVRAEVENALQDIRKWYRQTNESEFTLPGPYNNYRRKLITEMTYCRFPNLISVSSVLIPGTTCYERTLCFRRLGQDEVGEAAVAQHIKEQRQGAALVGMRQVFKILEVAKKPLIGHNLMIDLMQLIHKFHGELPADYDGFVELVSRLFPTIYDTKCLMSCDREMFPNNLLALGPLFNKMLQPPFDRVAVKFADGFKQYEENPDAFAHEAAFDAYMTGVVFCRLRGHYTRKLDEQATTDTSPVPFSSFSNQINMVRGRTVFSLRRTEQPDEDGIPHLLLVENGGSVNLKEFLDSASADCRQYAVNGSAVVLEFETTAALETMKDRIPTEIDVHDGPALSSPGVIKNIIHKFEAVHV